MTATIIRAEGPSFAVLPTLTPTPSKPVFTRSKPHAPSLFAEAAVPLRTEAIYSRNQVLASALLALYPASGKVKARG